jgi:archaellum biogenesis ATPase FlaH
VSKPSRNSEHKRSIRPGIPDVVLWKIAGVIQHTDGSLEIPYYDLAGNPNGYSRTRLPHVRSSGQKYDQPKGSAVHVYLPPTLQDLLDSNTGDIIPVGSCCLCEGEFKATALACMRIPAIGLPGLYACKAIRDEYGRTIAKEILDDLLAVIRVKNIKTLFFIGDADTAHNFLFSFEAWALAVAARKVGVEVYLPRLDVSGPKGVDDLRETFIGSDVSLKAYFAKLIEDAVHLDPDKGPQALARLLMEDQEQGFATLAKTQDWPRIQTRLAKMCAWAQLCRHKDAENTQRLIASAGRISSLSTADFASEIKAQREHIQKRGQPDRDEPEEAEANTPTPELTREEREDLTEHDWEKSVEEISINDLVTFDRANDPDNRFGNRWLCAGDTVVFQGETGVGKSVLMMQLIIHWVFNIPPFGIKGARPYKSLLIEAENNKGDLAEVFQDVVKAMELTADQINYLKTQVVIVRESAKTGKEFLKLARRLIKKLQPDLVFADPFLSYIGDNASDQKAMSAFLRNGLQPIVQASKVVWFWAHHFSKPPNDKPSTRRGVYSGFGSVELPGWARETMTLNCVNAEERLYVIEFGKRSRRVGLADDQGNLVDRIYIRQSKTGVLWEAADAEQVKQSGTGAAAKYGSATKQIRAFIEKNVNVTLPQLEAFAPKIPVGEKRAKSIARALVADANEPRIYEYKLKGQTNGATAFSTVAQNLNPLAYFSPKKRRLGNSGKSPTLTRLKRKKGALK